jgi:hypothetical protein
MRIVPSLFVKSGKMNEARDLLCDESFILKRFEFLGLLQCTTIHLTDADLLVRQLYNTANVNEQERGVIIEEFSASICIQLKDCIDKTIKGMESNDGNFYKHNDTIEAGKAYHLIALFLGSLGFITKELEYHATAIQFK